MKMSFLSHADKTHFQIKGFARGLALKKRHKTIQKWPIKAAGDKLFINKFLRQNFGRGLTLKTLYLERLGADSVET